MNLDEIVNSHLLDSGFEIAYENIADATEEEFPKIRMMGFGASDSSKVLGVSPFNTRLEVISEKVTGETDSTISQKPNVRKGKELEPIILSKAESYFEQPVDKPIHMYGDGKGALVNFDGVMLDNGETIVPVEAKLVSIYGRKYYDFSKSSSEFDDKSIRGIAHMPEYKGEYAKEAAKHYGVPVYYYTQLQQQIHFIGSRYGYLVVLDDKEWELRIFRIHANDKIINKIIEEIHAAQKIVEYRRGQDEDDTDN